MEYDGGCLITKCIDNYEPTADGAACVPCQMGYESAGVICTPCTNANAEIFDATPAIGCKITQCENNYALNTAENTCSVCPTNTGSTGRATCTPCAVVNAVEYDQTPAAGCKVTKCKDNYNHGAAGASCTACPVASFSSGGTTCTPCNIDKAAGYDQTTSASSITCQAPIDQAVLEFSGTPRTVWRK